jgi:membrane-bound ClpP family serine protease
LSLPRGKFRKTGMTAWQIVLAAGLVAGLVLALYIILLSRHKKAGAGDVDLLGAMAVVETTLDPEGSVLVRGELWRARLARTTSIRVERGQRVRVVGAGGQYLLEVEPVT